MLPPTRRLAVLLSVLLGVTLLAGCGNSEAHALSPKSVIEASSRGPTIVADPLDDSGAEGTFPDGGGAGFTPPADPRPTTTEATKARRHPFLLFDAGNTQLQEDALDDSTRRHMIFRTIRKAVDANGASCPYTGISAYGLCYALTGQTSYARAVYARLKSLALETEWEGGVRDRRMGVKLTQFALGFDLCYDYLKSQSDFRKLRDKLARETFKMHQAATQGYNSTWENWWQSAYSQNHFHRNISGLTFGALALKFEGDELSDFDQRDVDRWIATARKEWTKNHAALAGNIDGAWYEGTGYEETALGVDIPDPLYVLRRIEGLDLLTSAPWLRMVSVFWIYNSNPETARSRLTQFGDNGAAWSRQNGLLSTLRLCARLFDNRQAQWAADQLARDGKRDPSFKVNPLYIGSVVTEFVYYDESVSARSPEGVWADSWHAKNLEMAFLRDGWERGKLHAALKCGAYGGHALFKLARDNYMLTDGRWKSRGFSVGGNDGTYPQDFYFATDHAHPDNNGLYILGRGVYLAPERPGNKGISRFTASHNTITINGRGQIGDGDVHPTHGADRQDFFKSDGRITTFAPTDRFDLSVGDATRCYPRGLGLTEFRRHLIYLKPDYFVVFDTLDAKSERTYDWHCHFTNGVEFEGRWVKGKADGGNILAVNVVSPDSYSRQVESLGQSEDFKHLSTGGKLYALRLTAKGKARRRFITVLYPTINARWDERPTVEKISETATAAGVRVHHGDGAEDVVLCGYHADGLTGVGAYTTDALAAVLRRDAAGNLVAVYLAKGSRLDANKQIVARLTSPATSFEAFFAGRTVEVTGVGIPRFELLAPKTETVYVNGGPASFTREGDWITVLP